MTRVSFVFDDGFTASCLKVAEIFEARNLHATFAVLADNNNFMPNIPKGNFSLWNDLQARGHTIHPHGFDHSDLSKIQYSKAVEKIDACLTYFTTHLSGFSPTNCIYHTTYNRTTPEIDAYLLSKVRAIRSNGPDGRVGSGLNCLENMRQRILTCSWHGPTQCDKHFWSTLLNAEKQQPALFLYMMHGVDNEGWGPVHSGTLLRSLDYILTSPSLIYSDLKEIDLGSE